MKQRHTIYISAFLLLFAVCTHAIAQSASYSEYDIQAGYIYKFISFIEWPAEKKQQTTITIGIIGNNPFGNAFKEIEGKRIEGHTVVIKYFDSSADYETLDQCQLLYISKSESKHLESILTAVENDPVLTISDSKKFIEKGGVIGFIKKKKKITFEINNVSAEKATLEIRSMLKRIADRVIVETPKKKGGRDA
jgi:hypothetical protein